MRSRMDRYHNETKKNQDNFSSSRSDKNRELYQNIGTNSKYTNFTDVSKVEAVELGAASKNYRTREGYHQIKEYGDIVETPKVKRELDEFNYLYQDHENRVYDINSVLRDAKKNRDQVDDLEKKRKLKNNTYNILEGLNSEELEKYKQEKKNSNGRPDEAGLRELIDTITSKTLRGEIDTKTGVNLLSDLMATSMLDKVPPNNDEKLELSRDILDKDSMNKISNAKLEEKVKTENKNVFKDMDQSFYTRSMDLSDKDFEMDQEIKNIMKEGTISLPLKIVLVTILLLVIGVAIYFVITGF